MTSSKPIHKPRPTHRDRLKAEAERIDKLHKQRKLDYEEREKWREREADARD